MYLLDSRVFDVPILVELVRIVDTTLSTVCFKEKCGNQEEDKQVHPQVIDYPKGCPKTVRAFALIVQLAQISLLHQL